MFLYINKKLILNNTYLQNINKYFIIVLTMTRNFRYYQTEADIAISEELLIQDKCIIKMFCGTGKSLLMRYCKINHGKKMVVYVFPSLALIDQFYTDYLHDYPLENILKISSENQGSYQSGHQSFVEYCKRHYEGYL